MCVNPIRITKNINPSEFPDGLMVPCGKCLQCRIQYRKEWTARLIHEMDNWDRSIFVTLTYSDESLPENSSLDKHELQLFIKRLRKSISPRKIKYFGCGEYGEITQRPHYHLIIFGLGFKDLKYIKEAWSYADWKVPAISRSSFGFVEPDSIRYVCQYVDKKLSGELEEKLSEEGRENTFKIASNGLGYSFLINNIKQLMDNEGFTINGVKHKFPRYYIKKIIERYPEYKDAMRKLASEKEIENVEHVSGIEATDDQLYKNSNSSEYMKYYERNKEIIKHKSDKVQGLINLKKRSKI